MPFGIISAGIGALGSLATSAINANQAGIARSWQERMSNTAHQREVKDLRAAGINPILTATGGPGASSPTTQPVKFENPLQNVGSDYSAVQGQRLSGERLDLEKTLQKMQLADIAASIQLKESQSKQAVSQVGVNEIEAVAKAMLQANPDWVAAQIRSSQQGERTSKAQETASYAAGRASDWSAQGKSLSDVVGKILSSTLEQTTGTKAPSLMDIVRGIINLGPPTPHAAPKR